MSEAIDWFNGKPFAVKVKFDYSNPSQSGAERSPLMLSNAEQAAQEFISHWGGLMPWQINLALAMLMEWNAKR